MWEGRLLRLRWLVLVVLVAFGRMAAGQALLPAEMQQGVDRTAAEVMARTGVPSASVAVVREGKVAYVKAYGLARLVPALKATPAMPYPIGSVSKQFTAALLLLLQQDGKLRLDDPVGRWLPELTRSKDVTIREVLSMTSGYQDFWAEDYVMTSVMLPTTPEHILAVWGRKPLDFEPGTTWQYSNTNYVIAGRIAEIVGGKPVMEQLRERIFGPLGMTGVLDADASRLPEGDPVGYYRHALGPLRPAPQEGSGWMFAAGELAMPASDLATWNLSLMKRSLLKPESYVEMFADQHLRGGAVAHYGLGVELRDEAGRLELEHSGEVSGFTSENVVFPNERVAVTVLTNQDASGAASMLAEKIEAVLFADTAGAGSTEDHAMAEQRTRMILEGLQHGRLDRRQMTEFCNAYFSEEAIKDFQESLRPLGVPTGVEQVSESLRGGMRFLTFEIRFAGGRTLTVTEYEMPDGKLEQFLVLGEDS